MKTISSLVLALGTATAAAAQRPDGSPAVTPRALPMDAKAIVVLPFSISGPTNLHYLGDGMADLVQSAVDEIGGYRVIDRRAVSRRLQGEAAPAAADAALLAKSLGAGLVIGGRIVATGGELQVTAELLDVGRGRRAPGRASSDVARLGRVADSLVSAMLPGKGAGASGKSTWGTTIAAGKMTPGQSILVLDFAAAPQDSTLARLASDAMRIGLDQSGIVRTMAPDAVATALQRMRRPKDERITLAVGRELARRSNVKAVVEGELSRVNDVFLLVTRLVSATNGEVLANATTTASSVAELPQAAEELSRRLRLKIGESLEKVQLGPSLEHVTTPSFEALELYSRGARAHDVEQDYKKAADLLRQAVALDSNFAMAWRKLAVTLTVGNIGSVQQFRDAVDRAFRFRDRLTEIERLNVEFVYYTQRDVTKQISAAEEIWRRRTDPADSSGAGNLAGFVLNEVRDYARAEALIGGALRANPDQNYQQMVSVLLLQRKFRQADSVVNVAMAKAPARQPLLRLRFACSMAPIAECQRLVDSARASTPRPTQALINFQSDVALARGQIARSDQLWSEYKQLFLAGGGVFRTPGPIDVYRTNGIDGAVRLNPAPIGPRLDSVARPTDSAGAVLGELAKHYAWAGRVDSARALIARARAHIDGPGLALGKAKVATAEAYTLLAEGRWRDAIAALQAVATMPYSEFGACGCVESDIADAYYRGGMADSALVLYQRAVERPSFPGIVWERPVTYERICALADSAGKRDIAARYCQRFIDAWSDADAELQPRVAEARRRLARLTSPKPQNTRPRASERAARTRPAET